MTKLYHTIALIALTSVALAQPGTLDATFGTGGIVTSAVGAGDDVVNAIAIQPDGKIVAAGFSYGSSTINDLSIARYNPDGTLDATFGTGGTIMHDVQGAMRQDRVNAVAIQGDGKIVVAGEHGGASSDDFVVMRFKADGSVDSSFGTSGVALSDFSSNEDDEAHEIIVQPDGKILVVGTADFFSPSVAMVRFDANGQLDATFGTSGKVEVNSTGGEDMASCAALQSDGKIIVGGQSWGTGNWDFALSRYNADGTIDSSFGTNGWSIHTLGSNDDNVFELAIQPDGKIVAAGFLWNGTSHDFTMMRFNADGSPDNSFGTSGQATTPIGAACEFVYAMRLQADGRIVSTGSTWASSYNDVAVVKYNADGTLDNTFGGNGIVTTDVDAEENATYALAIQADGKVVVGGLTDNGTESDYLLVRYNNDVQSGEQFVTDISIKLRPNPASHFVIIQTDARHISLLDAQGRLVESVRPIGNAVTLDLAGLAAGLYHVRVETTDGLAFRKLIVQ